MTNRRRAAQAIATVAVALVLAACGTSPTPEPSPTASPTASPPMTATVTATVTPATVTQAATITATATVTTGETVTEPATGQALPLTEADVESVHDGDTFTLTDGSKVRVLGIDTPEVPPAGANCYGPEATNEARAELDGRSVQLQRDPAQPDKDQYGRLLRYVFIDGNDFADHMLAGGFARVFVNYPVARTPQYMATQAQAQADNVGLWKDCPND